MKTLLRITALLTCSWSIAQAGIRHGLELYGEYVRIDSTVANEQGIGNDAGGVGAQYAFIPHSNFFLLLGLGVIGFDDKEEFQELVVEERFFGDDRVLLAESDASALSLHVEAAARTDSKGPWDLSTAVGFRFLDAERDITDCPDCREEDLDVDGGVYVQPGIRFSYKDFEAILDYSFYLTGDIDGVVGLTLGFYFGATPINPVYP